MENTILIRQSLVKNLSKEALTDEQLGQIIRLVLRRSLHAEIEFMEEKEVIESEFFTHEDGIVALTAQLLWSDVKLLRQELIELV
jgi:hypothetical protein